MCFLKYQLLYLKDRDPPSTALLPRWLQHAGVCQARSQTQKPHPGLPIIGPSSTAFSRPPAKVEQPRHKSVSTGDANIAAAALLTVLQHQSWSCISLFERQSSPSSLPKCPEGQRLKLEAGARVSSPKGMARTRGTQLLEPPEH